jgi:hypothetical protein
MCVCVCVCGWVCVCVFSRERFKIDPRFQDAEGSEGFTSQFYSKCLEFEKARSKS